MSIKISENDLSSIQLNETDIVSSVLQNIAIILKTKIGTVPLYREFGVSGGLVDKPIHLAAPLLIAEIRETVELYEPRARVVNIEFKTDKSNPARLIPTVEVDIK